MQPKILTEKDLLEAATLLKEKELVAFPTETVYGLGAAIFETEAIQNIFSVKGRPAKNPLIAHIAKIDEVEKIAEEPPETFFRLLEIFFPGPLTLIVKKRAEVSAIVSGGLETIAIRMPSHPIARKLIALVGQTLVAPSANLSGRPSSTCVEHVIQDFAGKIAAAVDGGPCQLGLESTVLDLVSFKKPTLLRLGAITKDALEEVLQCEILQYTKGPKSSPGMCYRHYSPNIPVHFFSSHSALEDHLKQKSHVCLLSTKKISLPHEFLDAKNFYAHLRNAEKKGYDEILIFHEGCQDAALFDRWEKMKDENDSH